MNINYHFKKFQGTPAEKKYIAKRIETLAHFARRLKDDSSQLTLECSKLASKSKSKQYSAVIRMSVPGKLMNAKAEAASISAAVDMVEEKMKKQISKYKAKSTTDKQKKTAKAMVSRAKKKPTSTKPKIRIYRKSFSAVKPISEEEAIAQMKALGHDFFLFWNAASDKFSVIHKHKDGYRIVDPK